jgi:hypothetical protein
LERARKMKSRMFFDRGNCQPCHLTVLICEEVIIALELMTRAIP